MGQVAYEMWVILSAVILRRAYYSDRSYHQYVALVLLWEEGPLISDEGCFLRHNYKLLPQVYSNNLLTA